MAWKLFIRRRQELAKSSNSMDDWRGDLSETQRLAREAFSRADEVEAFFQVAFNAAAKDCKNPTADTLHSSH